MEREKGKSEITEINGVILTPAAFTALRSLQEDQNALLNSMSDKISDISDFFARELNTISCSGSDHEFKIYVNELAYLRRYIKDLRKPPSEVTRQ